MQQDRPTVYTFRILEQFSEILQGISSRHYGDIRKFAQKESLENLREDNFRRFLQDIGIEPNNAIGMQQRHTETIAQVQSTETPFYTVTDGLLTDMPGISLYAVTADCLPIVFYDPVNHIIGVVHAGYKGLLRGIIQHMVARIKMLGGDPGVTFVGIGPGIGVCCYDVPKERAALFEDKYSHHFVERNGKIYLDLKSIAKQALVQSGISEQKIETMPYCTSDERERFFSFRADSEETFGHFATMIGIRARS